MVLGVQRRSRRGRLSELVRRTRGAESRGGRQRRATGQPRHSVHALPRRRQPAWPIVHHAPKQLPRPPTHAHVTRELLLNIYSLNITEKITTPRKLCKYF
ncbi:hypothetical protein B5X24_HaOG202016 [Helicoverpa armigera]|uniref:Uncharacterized protein n=1 Tax=Helicoverpa armigera TaxID=29058 RepID=A0A2W1BZ82_HELAM|nr:hypothetical protein B5X24_HaOG202016 [Helicoverpa armigera]